MSEPDGGKEDNSEKESPQNETSVDRTDDLNSLSENDSLPSPTSKTSTANVDIKLEQGERDAFSFSPSQDKLTCSGKKNPKINRRCETNDNFPLITKLVVKSFISQSNMKDSQSNRKLYQIYPNPDELCEDCRWLVKATKSSESMKSSSEDEKYVDKWIESRKHIKTCKDNIVDGRKSTELVSKDYSKEEVSKLLSEVHSRLLECNILLTTQKLQKKFRKSGREEEVVSETSLQDDWFDQIQAEEDTKDGASKLCLILERLVSKYLKCSER